MPPAEIIAKQPEHLNSKILELKKLQTRSTQNK